MGSPSISKRGLLTPESPIRKLAVYAEEAKKRGIEVLHLNIGQPDIHTPPEFFESIQNFSGRVLAYGPSNGLPELREKLIDYYHRNGYNNIEQSDIMVTTAGSEAVLFSMMAVASPGEQIITLEPFYPNYNGFARMAGIELVPIATDPNTGYHLPSRDEIEKRISPKTKALLICTPNNPTGTVLTREEMETVESIVYENNLFVICDEVYREFVFEGTHTSILSFPKIEKHTIMTDSLSKRYSACGARIGCIVSKNRDVMDTVLKFGQARLCPPTLEQVAAAAMVESGDRYFKDMIDEYRKRRDFLHSALTRIDGVEVKKPEGAFYMMVTFPVDDIEDFSKWLLSEFEMNGKTTMLAPGPGFYATEGMGKREARIAYVLNVEDLKIAVEIIRRGLEEYNK